MSTNTRRGIAAFISVVGFAAFCWWGAQPQHRNAMVFAALFGSIIATILQWAANEENQ